MKIFSTASLTSLLIIVVLTSVVWMGQYVKRDLWEPDEARYTYVAQEMDQSDSWFMPLRNGEPYAHKPPLMFWLIKAGTFVTDGDYNGISGRLPSLLGAILALWAFLNLSTLWFNRQTAWRGVAILLTSYLFWSKGGMGQIDMLLLGLEMCAIALLFSADQSPQTWRYVGAFALMGLGILAKGPVGLIIPIGIYLSVSLATGNIRKALTWRWLWGIGLALLFPLCWLLLAKLNGAPDSYFDEILFKQNIGRVTGNFGGHVKPFYYYAKYLLIDFLPWIFLVPGSLLILFRGEQDRSKVRALLAWIFFVVLFFSLSSSKRNLYILSVYPAASLLLAAAMPKLQKLSRRWQQGTVAPLLVLLGILGLALLIVPWVIDPHSPPIIYPPLAILLLVGTFLLYRSYRAHGLTVGWVYLGIGVFFLTELYAGTIVLPAFNPIKTPVLLAAAAVEIIPENQPLLLYRIDGEILALYSHRRGKKVGNIEELLSEINATQKGVAVFTQGAWSKLGDQLAHLGTMHQFTMGSKDLCWLEYHSFPDQQPLSPEKSQQGPGPDVH
jgi:4-amino-4-deoxy-L-arabinose transferase-like glycosyltransferase